MMVQFIESPSGPDGRYVKRDLNLVESVFTRQEPGFWGVVSERTVNDLFFYDTASKKNVDRSWEIWRQK